MRMALAAFLLCAGLCATAQTPVAADNPAAAAARRELWLQTEGRYVRRWMLLGPLSPAQADELARPGNPATLGALRPGLEQRFKDDGSATWRLQSTYGNVLDGFSAGGMKNGQVG